MTIHDGHHDLDALLRDTRSRIQEITCYSVANLRSDERKPFVALKAVEAYFSENQNQRLSSILSALYYPEESPTYPEAILKRYVAVFCILLDIGKANLIHLFTKHEALRDQYLPFDQTNISSKFPEYAGKRPFYLEFCQNQWKYTIPSFQRPFDETFQPEQILPIISRDLLSRGKFNCDLWKVIVHEDYNLLHKEKDKLGISSSNTFVLKTFGSASDHDLAHYEAEVKAFKHLSSAQGILEYHGTYVQNNTSNIILEYADQGNLDEYLKNVAPPVNGGDIIKLWQQIFVIIKALTAIHTVPSNGIPHEPSTDLGCHFDIQPANILVASGGNSPYEWTFKLANLDLNEAGIEMNPINEVSNESQYYDSPELSKPHPIPLSRRERNSCDIWSLGCVFSEIATWIAIGYDGLLFYRRQRAIENDAEHNQVPRRGFHDGRKVLEVVQENHRKLWSKLGSGDFVTHSVIDLMVEEMLEVPAGRPTADQLLVKSERLLSKAQYRYSSLKSLPPENAIVQTRPLLPRSPLSTHETSPPETVQVHPLPISNLLLGSIAGQEVHGSGTESLHANEFVSKAENEQLSSVDQISSYQFRATMNNDPVKIRSTDSPRVPLTPRLLISESDDFSSSAEQEHDSIFRRRTDSPRGSRLDGRQVSEAPLSVTNVIEWKGRRKTRNGTNGHLFDSQSLNQLGERDHIFIIDDSNSMSFHWNEVQNTLKALTYILKGVVPDGIDISLATSKQQLKGIRSTTKLLRFLDQQNAKSLLEKRRMDINSSISPFLRKHSNAMREWTKSGPTKRSRCITLYILTDGIWKGDENIDIDLTLLERNLSHLKSENPNSGVQFITFGDDPVGSSHLDRLDNELRGYNIDVTSCRGNIRKMLFGVGGSQGSEQKGRSKNRLPALKNGIRRISTTLSMKSGSGEAKAELNHTTNRAAALQLKPRSRRLVQGLFELTTPPHPTLDVLFVHGLDGDREKDWVVRNRNTSTQINWPKDLMYQRFRDVRILTYGYDSAPWHSSYPIKDVITSQARVLLESVVEVREHTPDRPLIILAQGTGSLLTKSALLQSHLSLDADATKEKAIKLSTTGLILLDPPDLQISGESIVPVILESHVVGESGKEARKLTPKDAVWLKLQMESFQSISESFSIRHFHTCKMPHESYKPFLPTTNSTRLLEEPKIIGDNFEATNTSRFSKSFEVDRVNNFGSEEDQDYQAIIQVFEDLYHKANDESKSHWSTYAMDKASVGSNEVGFNSSDVVKIHPPRNEHFTGRYSTLDALYAALFGAEVSKQPRGTPSIVEIYGSAGMGKTQLALEFIHRYNHKFSSVLWIDSQNRASVERAFCRIERRLSRSPNDNAEATQASRMNISSSSESTNSVESARSSHLTRHPERQALTSCSTDLVKAWLAKESNSLWMIVFDGADDEQKSWIQEFFPNTKNGHILLTTRHRGLLKGSTNIHLDRMSEEDAVKLLLNYCSGTDRLTTLELVRKLDYVPLSIAQAGNYMKSTNLSPTEYLNRFGGAMHRDWDDYATRMKLVFSTSVNEVFETSYQEVKAKDRDALDLLILCAYLAAENIPELLLEAISKRSGLRLDDMIDTLFNNGFGHREENLQSFRMHTLVQSWLRRRHPPDKQQVLVSRVLTGLATFVESWRMRNENMLQGVETLLVKHIVACLYRVENIKKCDVSWCVLGGVCKQHKRYSEAIKLFEMGLSDPEITKKKGCSDRQRLEFELGSLYQVQGRSNDAEEKYEEILHECDQSPPDESSKHVRGQLLLDIYKSLSSVYTRIGRTQKSITVLNDGVTKFKELFGPNSFQTLQLLDLCAAEYYDQEDYAQAEQLSLWIVAAQTQTLGIDHPATIHAQERLARVYFQRSKFREAEELSRHCLAGFVRSLGPQHSASIHQQTFLGRICSKSHKFPEAEELLNSAVQGACKALGLQHPETLNAREELAICYEAQGKLEQAHAAYLQVMFGREDAKDPGIRRTLERLLPLMERMGMKDEARQLTVQWSNGFDGAA